MRVDPSGRTRLDLVVARRFGLSRRAAREAVRAGRVDVAGAIRDEPGLEIAEEADLRFDPNRPERRRVRTRLAVLLEDPAFLVVDKPAGLLTVPTAEHEKDTLVNRALAYLLHRYRRRSWVGVVHRLDKETSGALVLARTRDALRFLQRKFHAHDIEREYLALVEGDVRGAGVIDAPLVADGGDRRRGVARAGEPGKRAVTRYRPVERFGSVTLVSVRLETGRTHQIRVHFASSGHPVIGDAVYRRRQDASGVPVAVAVARQMLHAKGLGFEHPVTGEMIRAEAPLPADFSAALEKLRGAKKNAPSSPGALKKRPANPYARTTTTTRRF